MPLPEIAAPAREGRWTSLWVVALVSLVAQLWLCQFFSFGQQVPVSIDIDPSNLWKQAYHFPPTGTFQVLNWFGVAYLPQALQPLSLAASLLSDWWFFTAYAPLMATAALVTMAVFLRELEISRPASIFGGVIYAWQGDLLPFIYPGHYAYIATWFFFALAAWGALRSVRTGHWAYAVVSGAGCGLMVSLQPDRGGIASLLVALLFLSPFLRAPAPNDPEAKELRYFKHLGLCILVAAMIALAPLLALFQSYVQGVKLAGSDDREQTYKLVTQYSLGPIETLTYLAPGFFGWHSNHPDGPYWGWIGEWPDYEKKHQGSRNLNLAISTTGTLATLLALVGAGLLVARGLFGPDRLTARQRFYGRVLLAAGFATLVLSWGWHTGFYRPLFALPLMDKWRNPLKWLEMTNFAIIVLSAIGLDHVLTSVAPDARLVRSRLAWYANIWLLLLLLGWAITYPLAIVLTPILKAEDYQLGEIAGICSTMHSSMLVALVTAAAFDLVLVLFWQPERMRRFNVVNPWINRLWQRMFATENLALSLALVLAVVAALQLGWVIVQFVEPIPLEQLTQSNPLLEALRAEGDTVRVSVATVDPLLDSLLQNQFNAMRISSLDISAASRIPDDLSAFFKALDSNQERLLFLAGVKNLAMPESTVASVRQDPILSMNIDQINGYTLEPTMSPDVPSHALVIMKDYLAKATLVPSAEFFPTDDAVRERLKDPAWNPRETVLLNPGHDLPMIHMLAGPGFPPQVELGTYTPTQIDVRVQSSSGGFLLINDQFDPDWQTRVNGKRAELLRADGLLRAVEIPGGDCTVSMRYVAHYHPFDHSIRAEYVNEFSDGVMLVAWLVAILSLRRRNDGIVRRL